VKLPGNSAPPGPRATPVAPGSTPATAAQTAQAAQTTAAPVAPTARQAAQLGVRAYTESKLGGVGVRPDLTETFERGTRFAEAAVAYARLGKHQLAARRLGDAREQLDKLAAAAEKAPVALDSGNVHPGLWSAKARENPAVSALRAGIEVAAGQVEASASVAAVTDAPPAWDRVVMLFGSSCNPPTGLGGHAGIVSWGAKDLAVDVPRDAQPQQAREDVAIDEVWVLPVYKHIFSSKSGLLPFEDRFQMAKLGFEQLPGLEGRVRVVDAERQVMTKAVADAEAAGLPPESVRVGTVDVVRQLRDQHPGTQFVLALGADTYADLVAGKWKEGDALREMLPIVVVPRKGVDGVAGSEEASPDLSDISSTKVRGLMDVEFLKKALHPDVLQYMIDHQLYAFGEPKA
jgi:nicotinic acid mononucleotide adenylyltransferase